MVITYYTASYIKLQFGDLIIAINPVGEKSTFKAPKFGADIALISARHDDFNGASRVSHGDKQPVIFDGPGEYEVSGVFIKGFETETLYGGTRLINTVYTVVLEGMRLCFLGALATAEIPHDIREELGVIDICFVPTSTETGILDPKDAHRLATALEPKLIIPTHYTSASLKQFLEEEGAALKPVDKLTIKKKDLDGKEGDVVVLASHT